GVDTLLFVGMLVPQQAQDVEDAAEDEDAVNEVSNEPTSTSPTLATPPPPLQQEHIPSPSQATTAQSSPPAQQQPSQTGKLLELNANEDVTLKEVDAEVPKDIDVQGRLEES
nr:hypothetical protein [Tanacetum cinerariifolium]